MIRGLFYRRGCLETMPARDVFHDVLKNALIKDGWVITHDPLRLKWGSKDMYVDLGAEQVVTAEKAGRKIAVEIKSFVGASEVQDIEQALGQYFVYRAVMAQSEPERILYLAVHNEVFVEVFKQSLGQFLILEYKVPLIVFDIKKGEILTWLP